MPSFRPGWSVWVARTGGEVKGTKFLTSHRPGPTQGALSRWTLRTWRRRVARAGGAVYSDVVMTHANDGCGSVIRRSPVPVTGPRHRPTGRCEFSARPVGLTPSHEAPRGMQRATGASSGAKGASPVRTAAPNTSQNDRCEREFGCPQDFLSSPSRSLSVDIEVRLYNKRAEGKHCRP